jgi:hypothetical protein
MTQDRKILTVLTATVAEEKWQLLKETYEREIKQGLPQGLVSTRLLQALRDKTSWTIETTWRSLDELKKMREQEPVPAGIRIFRQAGADPTPEIYDVVAEG